MASDKASDAGSDPGQGHDYTVIERDTVPAPAPQPGALPSDHIASLLKWLQPTDYLSPGNEFMKHLHSHVPGTGTWAHGAGPFRAWAGEDDSNDGETGRHSFLHVRGVAGSGKSVFAASTVRQLQQQQQQHQAGRVVLFFFFRQIVDKNHTARYLARDFAAQLLPHCPALVVTLTALSQEHAVRGNELALLWPALVEALGKDEGLRGRVYCVVDALDEMDDADFDGMVERLVALGTGDNAAARVMVTSRPLPRIERALARPGVARLRLDPALLSPDVARYVDSRMAALDPPLRADRADLVRQTICERASGLFLQARLMADNLAEGLRDGHIAEETLPDSLERLPRTLRAVYESMLREHARRSGVTTEQQAQVLMCVIHARRPLRLIELGSLVARMLHVDLGRGKDLVRAGCGRLLELLEDETVSVIHHSFTEFLKDASRRDEGAGAFPVLDHDVAHAMLAAMLLEYLDACPRLDATIDDRRTAIYEDRDFSAAERERRNNVRTDTKVNQPLASYALENLLFHVARVPPDTPASELLLAALDRHLVPDRPAYETWMLTNWSGALSASVSVLHIVAATDDGDLVPEYVLEHLIEREPALLDAPDPDGFTPLAYAADRGHGQLVKVLLARGADPTSGGKDGRTPLHRAAKNGRAAAVRHLLDAGVDPLIKTWPVLSAYDPNESREEEYTAEQAEQNRVTALSCAFQGDDTDVVKAFMPFIPPDEINRCLHLVSTADNVRVILETGRADVNCFEHERTKLYKAAWTRDVAMVRLLLEHGADPSRRCLSNLPHLATVISTSVGDPHGERGSTPLHGLAACGFWRRVLFEKDKEAAAECLALLVGAGADVNATMDDGRDVDLTPLHLTVQRTFSAGIYWGSLDKSEEILTEVLLSAGADPHAKTGNGNTPLHLANPDKPYLLDLLVAHGADINVVNALGRPPLLEMICRVNRTPTAPEPDVAVFFKLLDLGADVHAADNKGNTVLHHMMRQIDAFTDPQFAPFLERLLRAGVDPNRRNHKGQPPLWKYNPRRTTPAAAEPVLRTLLAAGMDLNARDPDGRTVLWKLTLRVGTGLTTLEYLIHLGVDPCTPTPEGATLLHCAAQTCNPPPWFRFLLSTGIPPAATDAAAHHDTALHTLLREGSHPPAETREIVDLLLAAGVPPGARNAKRQSALHVPRNLARLTIVLATPAFAGLDINERDAHGYAPLHWAVQNGLRDEAVARLVRAGAEPAAVTSHPDPDPDPGPEQDAGEDGGGRFCEAGLSPLHIAARAGQAAVVWYLLAELRARGALAEQVCLRGGRAGRTALHHACAAGSAETAWALLRAGADVHAVDGAGWTALHALAEMDVEAWRSLGVVDVLVRAGAEVDAEGEKGETPLDVAVQRGRWKMVRRLLAHGAKVREGHKLAEGFVLNTDKELAAEEVRKAQAGAPPRVVRGRNVRWRGRWAACPGATPPPCEGDQFVADGQDVLDLKAQWSGEDDDQVAEVLRQVMDDGDYDTILEYAQLGDILQPPRNGRTILHRLVDDGNTDLLAFFGSKVAEFEARERIRGSKDVSCGTLLGTACQRPLPSLHIVQTLVEKAGVDVNAVHNESSAYGDMVGATALHILAQGTSLWQAEAIEYLLSRGADIEARNGNGRTPLLTAANSLYGFWREETARVLLQHGADPNATVEGSGASALELSNHPGTTRLLLEHGASVEHCPGLLTRAINDWMEPGIARVLLDAGLDPNELPQGPGGDQARDSQDNNLTDTNEDVRYPLHAAALTARIPNFDFKPRQQAVIDLLVARGANVHALYPDGSSVLQAIVEDRGEFHRFLSGLSQAAINRRGRHGRTLLASACKPSAPPGPDSPYYPKPGPTVLPNLIFTLLSSHADPLTPDATARTPLHWLSTHTGPFDAAHRAAFTLLTHRGRPAIHARDAQGHTPLHLALSTYASRAQASPFAIRALLSAGADPADPDPATGDTALHSLAPRLVGEAEQAGQAAALFRELVSRVGINARNKRGETAVFALAAARSGRGWREGPWVLCARASTVRDGTWVVHAEALGMVVELGADVKAVDARGRTLLHVTAGRETEFWEERVEVEGAFRRLMEMGVDPRAEDGELRTAIDVAVAKDLRGVVKLFAAEGRDE